MNRLLEAGVDINDFSSNYITRTPDFPDLSPERPEFTSANVLPFGDKALDWLGLNPDSEFRGENILVAVLDTPVFEHRTLKGKIVKQFNLAEQSNSDEDGYSAHGTAVGSLISGQSPDAPGVAPEADILSISVLGNDGIGDTFTLAKGIMEAVDRGADIINMSLGSYGNSPEMRRAIDYALENDVAIVAAAGNDGKNNLTYPADMRES